MDEKPAIDALCWQEVLYRLQCLEDKVHQIEEDIRILMDACKRGKKSITWRDVS